jgi:hypothetical protein
LLSEHLIPEWVATKPFTPDLHRQFLVIRKNEILAAIKAIVQVDPIPD